MKKLIAMIVLVFVGTAGWRLGNNLSSDAVSMAVGIFFGVLAGIPTALLVLASERYKTDRAARNANFTLHDSPHRQLPQPSPHQPPVIILNGNDTTRSLPQNAYLPEGNQYHPHSGYAMPDWQTNDWAMAASSQRPSRRFKVVGEEEEWLE